MTGNHSFNPILASQYGIAEAVLFQNIYYWCVHNKQNGINYNDGSYWTFNSHKAFAEQFPYLSEPQVKRALTNLIKNGLIKKGNYNAMKQDRTCWYAITELGIQELRFSAKEAIIDTNSVENGNRQECPSNRQNCQPIRRIRQMQKINSSDALDENDRPLPYINQIINSDNKHQSKTESSATQQTENLSNDSTSANSASEKTSNNESLDDREVQSNDILLTNTNSETVVSSETERKKKTPAKKKESFPKETYDAVFEAYFANRRHLKSKNMVMVSAEDYALDYKSARSLVKRSFTAYGTEKVIQAVKDSLHYSWLYTGANDYQFNYIFGSTVMQNLVNKTWQTGNKNQSGASVKMGNIAVANEFESDNFF